jgi:hypothetical protein
MHQSWSSSFLLFNLCIVLTMPSPSIQDSNPFCPSGGNWYVCTSGTRFLGCCTSDPCQNGCADDNLRAASYNTSYTGTFADQQCDAGRFYTCAETNPPFLGCCKSNPCVIGHCQQSDLASAFLSSDPVEAANFTASLSTSSATPTATASIIMNTTIPQITPQHVTPSHGHLSIGAIIGIALGSFVLFLALAAILVALCQRRSNPRTEEDTAPFHHGFHTNMAHNFNDSPYGDATKTLTAGMYIAS